MAINPALLAALQNVEKWQKQLEEQEAAAAALPQHTPNAEVPIAAPSLETPEATVADDAPSPQFTEPTADDDFDIDGFEFDDDDSSPDPDPVATWQPIAEPVAAIKLQVEAQHIPHVEPEPVAKPEFKIKGLDEKAVLVQVKRRMYSPYKRDEDATEQYGAGNVNKHLFEGRDNPVRQTISKFTAVYSFVKDNTVPWSNGIDMLNINNYFDFTTGLRTLIADAMKSVDDLVAKWDDTVQADLDRLMQIDPKLANPSDYLSADQLRERFGIEVRYIPVPTTGDFRVEISDDDKASLQAQLDDVGANAVRHVLTEMLEPMERAVEKLNVPIGSDGAIFRDSLIDNIVDVSERMKRVNLSDDPIVTDKIDELNRLAHTYANNKDALRSMPEVRRKAATQINDLVSKMSGLV